MDKQEKYIARLMLKVRLMESDKQAFEDLFTKIMQNASPKFKQVKPQGPLGDGKCDGFNEETGNFYQVYAPEDLAGKEDKANTKMEVAFKEMLDTWTAKNFDVKTCIFVINDKYKNVYASLHANAKAIGLANNITCEIMICKDIEDTLLALEEDKIIDVLGIVPNPLAIESIEYDVMNEIIGYLLHSQLPNITETIPVHPDFDKKIEFNSLSKPIADILNACQRQSFVIREYFELNSNFAKDDLRRIFNSLYQEALKDLPDSKNKNDEVFQLIVQRASPKNNVAYNNAVYVLMSYYFEYCDIFEAPIV